MQLHNYEKHEITLDPATYKVQLDTVEKINDRFYSIFVIDLYDTAKRQYSKKLLARTTIKSNFINFKYELLKKGEDSVTKDFIDNSKDLLRTVRISNGM
jgi:hypothetical protein